MPNFVDLAAAVSDAVYQQRTPTDFVYGTVKGVSPLVIQPDKSPPLPKEFLVLSALCRPFVTGVFRHTHQESEGGTTEEALETVTVWRGLQAGDRVRMLKCNHGQTYYVLDREGDL